MTAKDIIKNYIPLLMKGDLTLLQSIFADEPRINTPMEGEILGKEAFGNYVINRQDWLVKKGAKSELFNTIVSDQRIVNEFIVYFKKEDQMIDLPVVLVADLDNDMVTYIRTYFSTWPLLGKHLGRKPVIHPASHLKEPEIIRSYMEGLKRPDKKLVLSLFEPGAYVREPSGAQYKHVGEAGRDEFYSFALKKGGIPLRHCSATFNGKSFAVEYIFDEWGNIKFEPEAGIAIYDIGTSGKLAAARIYDDATPPGED
jgi:hypothetical protein